LQNYVGKPIQCWTPAEFPGGWTEYAEDYCFVENTYWLPFEKQIPADYDIRDREMLGYYQVYLFLSNKLYFNIQWVPFVLALQALMFNIPHFFWRLLNFLSGMFDELIILKIKLFYGFFDMFTYLKYGENTTQFW
jgi:hypothetical protein